MALKDTSLPLSLQASLLARLDRLGNAREIAEIAAAIGRDFSGDLLALVQRPRRSLQRVARRAGRVRAHRAPGRRRRTAIRSSTR